MVTKEELEQIALHEKESRLKINRIDPNVKELFVEIAEESFCNDFGQLLKFLLDQTIEYQKVKEVILDKEFLINILENVSQKEKEEKCPRFKTMMSGRRIELKGGNKI